MRWRVGSIGYCNPKECGHSSNYLPSEGEELVAMTFVNGVGGLDLNGDGLGPLQRGP